MHFDQMKNNCRFSWIDSSQVITLPSITLMTNCYKPPISVCTEKGWEYFRKKPFNIIFINKMEWNKMIPFAASLFNLCLGSIDCSNWNCSQNCIFFSMEHEANGMKIFAHSWLETRRHKIFFRYSKLISRRKLMFWLFITK